MKCASFPLAVLLVFALPASATPCDCNSVVAKEPKQLTQNDYERCKGPIIAAAICNGWKEGRTKAGCVDHQTSVVWAASADLDLRAKGQACLAGSGSMDVTCSQ